MGLAAATHPGYPRLLASPRILVLRLHLPAGKRSASKIPFLKPEAGCSVRLAVCARQEEGGLTLQIIGERGVVLDDGLHERCCCWGRSRGCGTSPPSARRSAAETAVRRPPLLTASHSDSVRGRDTRYRAGVGEGLWRRRRSGQGRDARSVLWNVRGGRIDGRWCIVSVSRSRCARPTEERGWPLDALLIIISALSCSRKQRDSAANDTDTPKDCCWSAHLNVEAQFQ